MKKLSAWQKFIKRHYRSLSTRKGGRNGRKMTHGKVMKELSRQYKKITVSGKRANKPYRQRGLLSCFFKNKDDSCLETKPDGTEEWRNEQGQLHRRDGPALIEYFSDANKRVKKETWYYMGKVYRKKGPAMVEYYNDDNHGIKKETWFYGAEMDRKKVFGGTFLDYRIGYIRREPDILPSVTVYASNGQPILEEWYNEANALIRAKSYNVDTSISRQPKPSMPVTDMDPRSDPNDLRNVPEVFEIYESEPGEEGVEERSENEPTRDEQDDDRDDVASVSDFLEENAGKYDPKFFIGFKYIQSLNLIFPGRCYTITSAPPELFFPSYDASRRIEYKVSSFDNPAITTTLADNVFERNLPSTMVIMVSLAPPLYANQTGNPFTAESGGGHMNAIVIDNQEKILYVFDPNGAAVLDTPSFGELNRARDAAINYLKELFVNYGYGEYTVSFSDTCPYFGPQYLEAKSTDAIHKVDKDSLGKGVLGGYCMAWSLMLIQYSLMNPHLTFRQVTELMTYRFSPGELARRVNKFAGFVMEVNKNIDILKERLGKVQPKARTVLDEISECQKLIISITQLAKLPENKGKTFFNLMTTQQRQFYDKNCLLPQDTLDRLKAKGADLRKEVEKEMTGRVNALHQIFTSNRSKGGPSKSKVKPNLDTELSFELTLDSLEKLSRAQLQEAAKKYGIPANGTNRDIIYKLKKILEPLSLISKVTDI